MSGGQVPPVKYRREESDGRIRDEGWQPHGEPRHSGAKTDARNTLAGPPRRGDVRRLPAPLRRPARRPRHPGQVRGPGGPRLLRHRRQLVRDHDGRDRRGRRPVHAVHRAGVPAAIASMRRSIFEAIRCRQCSFPRPSGAWGYLSGGWRRPARFMRLDEGADPLAGRTHPARRRVVRPAGHHLHRVPRHPELAARAARRARASPATTGCCLYGGMDRRTASGSRRRSRPIPTQPRSASCSPPTPRRRASTSRTTARRLVHDEIPWNPNRLEQRNGRIDRHGQQADEVADLPLRPGSGYDAQRPQAGARATSTATSSSSIGRCTRWRRSARTSARSAR